MKIALVLCPYFTNGERPPLGLACINGALREAGHETVCFDLAYQVYRDHLTELKLLRHVHNLWRVADDEIVYTLNPRLVVSFLFRDKFPGFKWDLGLPAEDRQAAALLYVGMKGACMAQAKQILVEGPESVWFSTYMANTLWSLMVAKELKARDPELPILFGGPGVGLAEVQRFVLSLGLVDGLFVGEGERSAVVAADDWPAARSGQVAGVMVKRGDELVGSPRRMEPLDDLPAPSFAGFPLPGHEFGRYRDCTPNEFSTLFFWGNPAYCSRGCVNRCAFCSETAYWKGYRLRKAATVRDEIKRIISETGDHNIVFNDSAINGNPKWLGEFLELMIRDEVDALMCGYMMATPALTPELGQEIYRAGFHYLTLGIETFSRRTRERMNKHFGGEELFEAVRSLSRAGVVVSSTLLVGFPGETEDDYRESFEYMRRWSELSEAERGPGVVYWDAGYPVRLEAYSDLYNDPERFEIEFLAGDPPPLPEGLKHLEEAYAGLFRRWRAPGRERLRERCDEIREVSRRSWKQGGRE